MNGHVQLRLVGHLGDITIVLAELLASKAFRIVVNERPYPSRHIPAVRVYVELTLPTGKVDRP
ncbi:hypothetical protein [Nocardia sp. NPDC056000]|uniref:hypothetical protein n=1 Tax=Nocardia sp. NPDC056000 TaxID=3345674 RepID=UPI0035D7F655